MQLLSLSFLAFAATTYAEIILANQPSEQLPKIGRVNEPYSWTLSSNTFTSSTGASPILSAKLLPDWMSFDPATRTLSGIPAARDEGNPRIVLTAHDAASSASASFTICVTSFSSPVPNNLIADQFKNAASNKALSSVFNLAPRTALSSQNPALRIPPKWSFSIGFDGSTYTAPNSLFYNVLQSDGTQLPPWLEFNQKELTLDGVTPHERTLPSPYKLSLALHASDQEGYSAHMMPFDLYVASHELSQGTPSLPTINMTAESPFDIALDSVADFMGLLVDGKPIHPNNLTSVDIDTTPCPWLSYNASNRVLSGTPPSSMHNTDLKASVGTTFNQTIETSVSLALVQSFFVTSQLTPIQRTEDGCITFDLSAFYAPNSKGQDVDISVATDPSGAGDYLHFDQGSGIFSGCAPKSIEDVRATFTAYSPDTHSTSHVTLDVYAPPSAHRHKESGSHPSQLSIAARKRLALGLGITFAFIGGLCLIGISLAAIRHCARVRDSALGIEANQRVWSEKDKKWYGIGNQGGRTSPESQIGYGSPDGLPRKAMDLESMFRPEPVATPGGPDNGNPGVRQKSPFVGSNVMSKREFRSKIKDAVRQVSDQYQRMRHGGTSRPVIGRPIPLGPDDSSSSSTPGPVDSTIDYAASGLNSTISSPAFSTADQSVPRRRADFGPFADSLIDGETSRPVSYGSNGSLDSAETHAAEAIVQTATRATSVRSVVLDSPKAPPPVRPRIVPFNSSTRVPIPRMPSGASKPGCKRVPSQKAQVVHDVDKSASGDDLSLGIHYVRALGADQRTLGTNASMPTVSTNARSSFSSLESSHCGHADPSTQRMLVRAEQKFNFRVPVFLEDSPSTYTQPRNLSARLASGPPLPKFMRVDLRGKQQGSVEFYGTPSPDDIAEYDVEIYAGGDTCIARVLVEVVARV